VLSQEEDIAAGDYVMLSVTDAGERHAARGREAGVRAVLHHQAGRQGLRPGLSMVYGFIRQSNWHIKITARSAEGTSVKMYFPAQRGAVRGHAPARDKPLIGGTERILVVEDEETVRAIVGEQLRGLATMCSWQAMPSQALALLRSHRFDLVLTDVVMPGRLNGKDLADEVERSWPGTRVVFMSGYSENALLNDGVSAAA
jgi:CheY-like chemotaxis protein